MAQDNDWIDSTSGLRAMLRLTEVVLFCALPTFQAANDVAGSVPQHNSEARTPHSMALLCLPFAPFRSEDCIAGSPYRRMPCATSATCVDEVGVLKPFVHHSLPQPHCAHHLRLEHIGRVVLTVCRPPPVHVDWPLASCGRRVNIAK